MYPLISLGRLNIILSRRTSSAGVVKSKNWYLSVLHGSTWFNYYSGRENAITFLLLMMTGAQFLAKGHLLNPIFNSILGVLTVKMKAMMRITQVNALDVIKQEEPQFQI